MKKIVPHIAWTNLRWKIISSVSFLHFLKAFLPTMSWASKVGTINNATRKVWSKKKMWLVVVGKYYFIFQENPGQIMYTFLKSKSPQYAIACVENLNSNCSNIINATMSFFSDLIFTTHNKFKAYKEQHTYSTCSKNVSKQKKISTKYVSLFRSIMFKSWKVAWSFSKG